MPRIRRRHALALLAAAVGGPVLAQGKTARSGTPPRPIAGRYRALGRNPDGSAYSGNVAIEETGGAVAMRWQIGEDAYAGAGTREGRVVTVDWGESEPVIYVVMENGELHGTWAGGKALERLVPQQ